MWVMKEGDMLPDFVEAFMKSSDSKYQVEGVWYFKKDGRINGTTLCMVVSETMVDMNLPENRKFKNAFGYSFDPTGYQYIFMGERMYELLHVSEVVKEKDIE
jgi:hypothetical protein